MELQAKLNGLGGLNGRQLSPEAKDRKLREACEGFESIFIQKMWQEMRNAVPKTGILTGREERFWQDMYDQELSKSMTKAGGIGLADMMYEQLSRNLVSASRSAAGSATGAAFMPSAAPLLPEAEAEAPASSASGLAAAIYDGEAAETGAVAAEAAAAQPAPVVQASAQPEKAPAVNTQPEPVAVKSERVETAKHKKHVYKADLGQASGLQMAQRAKREAGDKLGSNAVRPGRQSRRERAEAVQAEQPVQTTPMPGSAEALRAAVEMAKSGAAPAMTTTQPLNLGAIVANAQAMNTGASAQPASQGQTVAASAGMDEAQPATRTVRFTTNVPPKADTRKKSKQAIRMLNVENVGVNSRQGKGLAAYHAQQEAAMAAQSGASQQAPGQISPLTAATAAAPAGTAQPAAPLTAADNAAAQAPIPPLTPKAQEAALEGNGNFAIPPLTAPAAQG
ncbi:MAG: peptidase M23 [Desulfovibrio sp.]|nr:peptidase M23 [Desulfovibrio sp.]